MPRVSALSCRVPNRIPTRKTASMSELHRFLDEAHGLLPDAVALRNRIHAKPELGLDLPLTTEAVLDGLRGLDLEVARGPSTSGLIVSLNGTRPGTQNGRTILLRGDMDALPLPEETGLDFASEFPGRCMPAATTPIPPCWSARHLLRRHRDELAGTVNFMFQPGEEGILGARYMIEDGLLDPTRSPTPPSPSHLAQPAQRRVLQPSRADDGRGRHLDHHRRGRGGHASMPHDAVDPIPVAFELRAAIQAMSPGGPASRSGGGDLARVPPARRTTSSPRPPRCSARCAPPRNRRGSEPRKAYGGSRPTSRRRICARPRSGSGRAIR